MTRHCPDCERLGDICPRCEQIAEQRANPEPPDDYDIQRAERAYERQLFGDGL